MTSGNVSDEPMCTADEDALRVLGGRIADALLRHDRVIAARCDDSIARVLARFGVNLQLAKITTLGERVEDTFLIDGSALQQNKVQLQIETELLDALAARAMRSCRPCC